jgi:GNAT superfamily N-acetyltransferase
MSAHIRPAIEADLPSVLALYAQPDLDNGQVLSEDEARAVFAQFARYPNYRLFVALRDGTVVGTYALLVMHNLAHRGAPSAIAEDVVVDKACQGQGIGRQMMAHALQRAKEAGCYKLALSSNRKRTDAHAFYESLGFQQHGLSFVMEP